MVKFDQFFAIFLNQSFEQMNQFPVKEPDEPVEDLHPTRLRHTVNMWGKN